MRFRTDFKRAKWWVSMNCLLSFQFCLNFGNLCIYRGVSSTVKVAVAAVCFCLIEIKCFANISLLISLLLDLAFATAQSSKEEFSW